QALQGGNQAAAAGGMAGSPQHEQQNMQLATNLGNQDYYNYLNPALGLYGAGLSGEQNLFNTGYGASTDLATTLANLFGTQGSLSYAGGANQNQMGLGTLGLGAGVLSSFNNPLKSLANAFSFS
ncbi:MAG TPA: hypothetical protein VKR58_12590, partial [Aquella sp.]|nr:hypothetical protein [Aquella sp.]